MRAAAKAWLVKLKARVVRMRQPPELRLALDRRRLERVCTQAGATQAVAKRIAARWIA